ncbi:class I SAM-dependent methyltransferase [Mycobacterium intracellulare]|uniref:class I SAM-dependent methyltransferase n=1 Tax=Mycobacterium intracellulare TaxID=1767 RepID=UPI00044E5A88|nr:methyltransferase domain-containing protein [Mycobacterium intracellulare]AOS90905.1 SAM-dependent methyltransferase [Mycobacterium intracellulare subsp. chimaera]ARV80862.1 SAM-dependent methyltransferase [Mycobacterium intracellulare subsp. chimaera]ASL07854.1 MerR family transcriptional regulator [Mycobacterium intracellulare subsp. chimaera]ASL19641.1 MerR family transcriptional regulator [Mycobacterium intracellulare subsp. chimaera]ETZ33669.1 methyltransferase domain protein [Mycobact
MVAYDRIGATYRNTRRPDPRIASQVRDALATMGTVVNVGAGTGSYEPGQTVAAIEPSMVMIAQRPPGSAPCVQAVAEALPLRDKCVDAAMALLTVHHWGDLSAGIAELRRVSRHRIVILTWDQAVIDDFWLLREYLPDAARITKALYVPIERLVELLGGAQVHTVPIPHDCTDGFGAAFWRRPEAYLDATVRAGISMLAYADEGALADGLGRLAADLRSRRWQRRHAELLEQQQLDAGYRLLISDGG